MFMVLIIIFLIEFFIAIVILNSVVNIIKISMMIMLFQDYFDYS